MKHHATSPGVSPGFTSPRPTAIYQSTQHICHPSLLLVSAHVGIVPGWLTMNNTTTCVPFLELIVQPVNVILVEFLVSMRLSLARIHAV